MDLDSGADHSTDLCSGVEITAPHGLVRTIYQPYYLLLHLIYGHRTLLLLPRISAEKERGGVSVKQDSL